MVRNYIYRCPTTGHNVQGSLTEPAGGADHFVAERCIACGQVHLVNTATGELRGGKAEPPGKDRRA